MKPELIRDVKRVKSSENGVWQWQQVQALLQALGCLIRTSWHELETFADIVLLGDAICFRTQHACFAFDASSTNLYPKNCHVARVNLTDIQKAQSASYFWVYKQSFLDRKTFADHIHGFSSTASFVELTQMLYRDYHKLGDYEVKSEFVYGRFDIHIGKPDCMHTLGGYECHTVDLWCEPHGVFFMLCSNCLEEAKLSCKHIVQLAQKELDLYSILQSNEQKELNVFLSDLQKDRH